MPRRLRFRPWYLAGGLYRAGVADLPVGVSFSTLTGEYTGSPFFAGDPALPSSWNTGTIVRPTNGTQLQTELNNATRGDTIIELDPSTTYIPPSAGGFTCPAWSGSGYVILRSGTSGGGPMPGLPSFMTRIDPASHESSMPTVGSIASANERALKCIGAGRGHLWAAGVRFVPPTADTSTCVQIGDGTTGASNLPSNVVFDRCYLKGDDTRNHRRGLQLHSNGGATLGCYMSGWSDTGSDAQAMASWHCEGRHHHENNYYSGSAENIMYGGAEADTPSLTLLPSDVLFKRCHFRKPASWNGSSRVIKNIFEIKHGLRFLVIGNILEGIWAAFGQHGAAFNVKTSGAVAEEYTRHVTCRYNKIINAGLVATISRLDGGTTVPFTHLEFSDNLGYDINTGIYVTDVSTNPLIYHVGVDDACYDHNTIVTTGTKGYTLAPEESGTPSARARITNNILEGGTGAVNTSGIRGAGTAEGGETLTTYFPSATVSHNAMINRAAVSGNYTVGSNWSFPTTSTVGFADYANDDYRITGGTANNAGSEGRDQGADIDIINTLTAGVASP